MVVSFVNPMHIVLVVSYSIPQVPCMYVCVKVCVRGIYDGGRRCQSVTMSLRALTVVCVVVGLCMTTLSGAQDYGPSGAAAWQSYPPAVYNTGKSPTLPIHC